MYRSPELAETYKNRQEILKPLQVLSITMSRKDILPSSEFDDAPDIYDQELNLPFLKKLQIRASEQYPQSTNIGLIDSIMNPETYFFRCFIRNSKKNLSIALDYLHEIGLEYDPTDTISDECFDESGRINYFNTEHLINFSDYYFQEGYPAGYFLADGKGRFRCISVYANDGFGLRHPIHELVDNSGVNLERKQSHEIPLTTMRDALIGVVIVNIENKK